MDDLPAAAPPPNLLDPFGLDRPDDLPRPLDRTIRRATVADLRFITALQRRHSNAVGFLPSPAIQFYLEQSFVQIATENGDPAGYLLGRPALAWQPLLRPITQAAVAMDAQRRHHGLSLLAALTADALAAGQIGLQACCRVGVEANEFWHAAGFVPICYLTPDNARARAVICWRKPLTRKIPMWFADPPKRAGHRATLTRNNPPPERPTHGRDTLSKYITSKITTQHPSRNP